MSEATDTPIVGSGIVGRSTVPDGDDSIQRANLVMLRRFSSYFLPALTIAFIVLVSVMVTSDLIILFGKTGVISQLLAIHLLQVGLGLAIALVCFFLGAAMCWFGITGTLSVALQFPNQQGAKLHSTHIGALLLAGGIVLAAIALFKQAEIKDGGGVAFTVSAPAPTDGKPVTVTDESRLAEGRLAEAKVLFALVAAAVQDGKGTDAVVKELQDHVTELERNAARQNRHSDRSND